MAIDQATRALLDAMAAQGMKPFHESTPAEVRTAGGTPAPGPVPAMRSVTEHPIGSPDGEM